MPTMPSKKRKYNARFPAGRIKKIMQTDEEVGKVAQAVPIIISRTLELFVQSLLRQALQVTVARNAKTLSPSHVKQCILAESRFDFLRDLVKNIPDVSAAEEKELMSAESSPTSSRFSEASTQSNCESRVQTTPPQTPRDRDVKRAVSVETEAPKAVKIDSLALTAPVKSDPYFPVRSEPSSTMPEAIDLTKRPVRTANFYQETLVTEEIQHKSVIKPNPTYSSPQPSTSYTNPVPALHRIEIVKQTFERHNSVNRTPNTPRTPVTPLINIDFSKNLTNPEIKVLDTAAVPKDSPIIKHVSRQNSKAKIEIKKVEIKATPPAHVDIDILNSGNLQIDEDYDT